MLRGVSIRANRRRPWGRSYHFWTRGVTWLPGGSSSGMANCEACQSPYRCVSLATL